ncbi:hypothetical protein AAG906_028995 [Vitis piasezkii]
MISFSFLAISGDYFGALTKVQTEKEMTLGDALPMNQVKDTALASIEELKNLAGDADIKGLDAVLDKAVHPKHGKRDSDGLLQPHEVA